MTNWFLTFIAYGAIIASIVIYFGENKFCNQDCCQGRNCNCEDQHG